LRVETKALSSPTAP